MTRDPAAAQKMIGDFAPKLADLTDRVLFGEVWEAPELSKRDRSLATVAALVALNRPDHALSSEFRARQWSEEGRTGRTHYASRFLFRLAERDERYHRG